MNRPPLPNNHALIAHHLSHKEALPCSVSRCVGANCHGLKWDTNGPAVHPNALIYIMAALQ